MCLKFMFTSANIVTLPKARHSTPWGNVGESRVATASFKWIDDSHTPIGLIRIEVFGDDFVAADLLGGRDNQRVVELDAIFLLDCKRMANEVDGYVNLKKLSEVVKNSIAESIMVCSVVDNTLTCLAYNRIYGTLITLMMPRKRY